MSAKDPGADHASVSASDSEPFEIVDREEIESHLEKGIVPDSQPDQSPQPPSTLSHDFISTLQALGLEDTVTELEDCIQLLVLGLVIHAFRPLRLNELADLIRFTFGGQISQPGKEIIRKLCAGFLVIHEDETVYIRDPTFSNGASVDVQGSPRHLSSVHDATRFHTRITLLCLRYLDAKLALMPDLMKKEWETHTCMWGTNHNIARCQRTTFTDIFTSVNLGNPFLQYASSQWAWHAGESDDNDNELFTFLAHFVDPSNPSFRSWAAMEWTKGAADPSDTYPSRLHVAAYIGLSNHIRQISEDTLCTNVDCLDNRGRTPLWWAATRNHIETVTFLHQKDASLESADDEGTQAIHTAIQKRNSNIVRFLLQNKVGLQTTGPRQHHSGLPPGRLQTAAEYACKFGDKATVSVCMPFASEEVLASMIYWSCEYKNFKALQTILDASGASPDSRSGEETALGRAIRSVDFKCVEVLLAHGVDVMAPSRSIQNSSWRTPLHILCQCWHSYRSPESEAALCLLLKAGADINALDESGDPPLFMIRPHEFDSSKTQRLLEAGADPNVTGQNGESIVHRCLSESWKTSNVELFLKYGADLSSQTNDGRTIWHAIMKAHHPDERSDLLPPLVDYLVRNGAGPTAAFADSNGCTGLEALAKSYDCRVATFEVLLNACPDPDARQRCLWLYDYREKSERSPYIRALITAGVNINANDQNGQPSLIHATQSWCPHRDIELLLDFGAECDVTDENGRSVLHYFCEDGYSSTVEGFQKLLNRGLDPHRLDQNGQTILHAAVKAHRGEPQHLALIKEIIASGVSPDQEDTEGRTALHLLFEEDPCHSKLGRDKSQQLVRTLMGTNNASGAEAPRPLAVTYVHAALQGCQHDVITLLGSGCIALSQVSNGQDLLYRACRSGDASKLGVLLAGGADAWKDTPSPENKTPLQIVCEHGTFEMVYCLLQWDVNVRACDNNGRTALHILAKSKYWWHLNGIRLLIQHGAEINARDKKGLTPLHIASQDPQAPYSRSDQQIQGFWWPECVELLLQLGADPNAMDRWGGSPFSSATYNTRATEIFLKHGSSLDLKRSLFTAISNRNLDSLNLLLEHGADPKRLYEGKRPLQWGTLKSYRLTPLLLAASNPPYIGDRSADLGPFIISLLRHGADPYTAISEQETLVHYVFERADQNITSMFVDEAVDVAARDQAGRTVLHAALDRHFLGGHSQAFGPLDRLMCNTDAVHAVDSRGRNILHCALNNIYLPESKILELLGFEFESIKTLLQQKDEDGCTPLNYSLKYLRPTVCERLADLGCDLLCIDATGRSALHHVARQFLRATTEPLLSGLSDQQYHNACHRLWQRVAGLGADINGRDNAGWTPLFEYFASPPPELFGPIMSHASGYSELLPENVDVHMRSNDGQTVLHVIANYRPGEIAMFDHPNNLDSFQLMMKRGVDPRTEDSQGRSSLDIAAARGRSDILSLFSG